MEIKTDFIFFLLYAIKSVLYNFICLDDNPPINNSADAYQKLGMSAKIIDRKNGESLLDVLQPLLKK